MGTSHTLLERNAFKLVFYLGFHFSLSHTSYALRWLVQPLFSFALLLGLYKLDPLQRESVYQYTRLHNHVLLLSSDIASIHRIPHIYCAFLAFACPPLKPMPYTYTRLPPRYAANIVAGSAMTLLIKILVSLGTIPGLLLRVHQLKAAPITVTSLMTACSAPTCAFFDFKPSRLTRGMNSYMPVATAGAEKRSVRSVV